ncbi:MAG: VOC family protein [Bacteroidota bacterium]
MKKRVTGIGGIFFKCDDPEKVKVWYKDHLGIESDEISALFKWRDYQDSSKVGTTVWGPFAKDTKYYDPSTKDYMINYRVENLAELLEILREEGVEIVGQIEEYEYGKFAWIMDPEGRKIELWEPIDAAFL